MTIEKELKTLTSEQKRRHRFDGWLNPDITFDSPEAEKAYKQKVTRFISTIDLKPPDRVPVLTSAGFFPAYYAGSTLKKVMYDYDELKRCWMTFLNDFEFDAFPGPGLVLSARQMELLGHRLHEWPGHGMSDKVATYQYVEGEYMPPEEYDDLIIDPTDYLLRTFLPRTNSNLAGLTQLSPMSPMVGIPNFYFNQLTNPDIRSAIRTMLDVADEGAKWGQAVRDVGIAALTRGNPSFYGSISQAPYDMIGDMMRGTRGVMLDMYKRPTQLLEAMDRLVPLAIREGVNGAEKTNCPVVFMPLHKGTGGFMSNAQFEKFYWPSLRRVLMGLIDQGLVPMLFAEGNYVERLEIIQDLPKKSTIWHFETMDMAKAKSILKDVACIVGNLPVSLLCTGTPEQVKAESRRLIDTCADGGGYILAGSASMNEGNPDNLRAMMAAAKEYGVY